MEIEKQVCSLELAKKLKELGEPQESLWYWAESKGIVKNGKPLISLENYTNEKEEKSDNMYHNYWYSAYTVAELGERLPVGFSSWQSDIDDQWHCNQHFVPSDVNYVGIAFTEVNARAKMLIYLLENKLMGR